MHKPIRSFLCLLAEISIWYLVPISFLTIYVLGYGNPITSALSHIALVSELITILILSRVLFFRINLFRRIAPILSATLYSGTLFCLLTYYGLVIVGLKSWGRVISEELIVSYYHQSSELCDALGYSYLLVILAIATIYLLLLFTIYITIKIFKWEPVSIKTAPYLINTFLISILLLVTYNFVGYLKYPPKDSKEPISLTLLDGKFKTSDHNTFQGISSDPILNALEDKTRSSYRVNNNIANKNLIFIVVDALRPDHMGVYGYHRNTTPHLSNLHNLGLLEKINNVHASCGESACGLASVASSRFIHQLPKNPITLQQTLQLHGYEIHMILGGDHTNFYNLKAIYGHVDSYFDGSMARNYYMNDDTFIIDRTKALQNWDHHPTMIQYHLMSAHTLGKRLTDYSKYKPSKSYAGIASGPPDERYTNYYDNGVLQADSMINHLLDTLKEKQYLQNALVVITADHGESLGEHNLFAHANSVREELLKLPLLLVSYGDQKPTVQKRDFLSQVDIAPSILGNFDIDIPETWTGLSIDNPKKSDFTFFLLNPDSGLYDHRNPKTLWKYWKNSKTEEEFAFDLTSDPHESYNLIIKVPLALKKQWRDQLSQIKFN